MAVDNYHNKLKKQDDLLDQIKHIIRWKRALIEFAESLTFNKLTGNQQSKLKKELQDIDRFLKTNKDLKVR